MIGETKLSGVCVGAASCDYGKKKQGQLNPTPKKILASGRSSVELRLTKYPWIFRIANQCSARLHRKPCSCVRSGKGAAAAAAWWAPPLLLLSLAAISSDVAL